MHWAHSSLPSWTETISFVYHMVFPQQNHERLSLCRTMFCCFRHHKEKIECYCVISWVVWINGDCLSRSMPMEGASILSADSDLPSLNSLRCLCWVWLTYLLCVHLKLVATWRYWSWRLQLPAPSSRWQNFWKQSAAPCSLLSFLVCPLLNQKNEGKQCHFTEFH